MHDENAAGLVHSAVSFSAFDDIVRDHHREDIRFALATPTDYAAIEQLTRSAEDVDEPWSREAIAWLLDANPDGSGFMVLARARDTDRILGYFTFYPKLLYSRSERVPAFLFVRLYVCQEIRRRGIFETMTRLGMALLKCAGIEYAYSVPNRYSTPGFVKLGMRDQGDVGFWVRPTWRIWPYVSSFPKLSGLAVEPIDSFGTQWDELFEVPYRGQAIVRGARSAARLNWRYKNRPDAEYGMWGVRSRDELVGYCITRVTKVRGVPALVVCDFWLQPGSEQMLRMAVATALREAGPQSPRFVTAFVSLPSGPERRAIRHAGFLPVPKSILPGRMPLIGTCPARMNGKTPLPDISSWLITPYDWDVY
jgi:predicted N-acetyltransferase YhbS